MKKKGELCCQKVPIGLSAELFAKDVLKENYREHSFMATDLNKPKHTEIFDNVGLKNIIAYSNNAKNSILKI